MQPYVEFHPETLPAKVALRGGRRRQLRIGLGDATKNKEGGFNPEFLQQGKNEFDIPADTPEFSRNLRIALQPADMIPIFYIDGYGVVRT